MFRVTSTMIKCSCRCYCSRNRGRLALHNQSQNWSKIKKKYINLRDHQNSAIEIVADTSSPVINDILRFFSTGSEIFFPQLQLVFLLQINWFWFSWVIRTCLEIDKTRKKIIWLLMATPIIFRVWRASWTFDFF